MFAHQLPAHHNSARSTLLTWPWCLSLLILTLDQLSKSAIVRCFAPGATRPLLPPVISLTYVQNTGAAFGLFKGYQFLFVAFALCIIGWIARQLLMPGAMHSTTRWPLALILGGAIGNVIDRVRLGYVIDFLDLHWWPVFNLGDSAITIGVTVLILQSLFSMKGPVSSDK